MANISKFLEKIKSAVYGKDMRQSLHDAIKETNDDLEEFKDSSTTEFNNFKNDTNAAIENANNDLSDFKDDMRDELYDVRNDIRGIGIDIGDMKSDISSLDSSIGTLTGNETVEGSVAKKIKDAINAFATAITDDGTVNTYKEVLEWIATHGADFAALVGQVNQNGDDLSNLADDIRDIKDGSMSITPTLAAGTTYELDSDVYGFASLLAMANTLANLKNGFAYNSEDSEWTFQGDVLNFDGANRLYLDDEYATTLNSSKFSGYSTLAAMAKDLYDVKNGSPISDTEKAQLIAEVKQAVIDELVEDGKINVDIDGGGFDEQSSE